MIDHVGFSVSDYTGAKAFYEKALAPLGYKLIMEVTARETGQPAAGFGRDGKPDFWIGEEGKLVLLRHKFLRKFRGKLRAHAGHRGSRAWPIA